MYSDNFGKIDFVSVGKRLREYRKSQKLTQQQFSEIIDYSVAYYSIIENGKAPNLNHRSLDKIAKKLDISSAWLIYGIDSEAPESVNANLNTLKYNNNTDTKRNYSRILQYYYAFNKSLSQASDSDKTSSKSIFATMLVMLTDLDVDDLETLIKCAEMQRTYKIWEQSQENNKQPPSEKES